MALNFQIPKAQKNKDLKTLEAGFGIPITASLRPSLPNIPIGDFPEGVTLFGTYYYGSLFIERPEFEDYFFDEQAQEFNATVNVLQFNRTSAGTLGCFIEDCIIDVTIPNNVVITEIAGQDGSIKEYINTGDAQISIRGFFSSVLPDRYPIINTRILQTYLKSPVSLKVTNDYLNNVFGITNIVVNSSNFFQQEGLRNVQYFRIDAVSDTVTTIEELSK